MRDYSTCECQWPMPGMLTQGRPQQGCCGQAYMEVFTAADVSDHPEKGSPATATGSRHITGTNHSPQNAIHWHKTYSTSAMKSSSACWRMTLRWLAQRVLILS